jgi:hypothetical protein
MFQPAPKRYPEVVKLAIAMYTLGVAMAQSQPGLLRTYQDPQGRFQFTYPAAFGTPGPGTDNGFRNRTAAIRFSEFSASAHAGRIILGGEAVLTSGAPQLDLQAVGGLYDAITLQIFPEPIVNVIRNALPVLTPDTFCAAIGRERHLEPADQRFSVLTAQQRSAIASVDQMGNVRSRVLRCEVMGATVTFEKEAAFDPAGATRHIYGSIRFLPLPYSSFQLIRGSVDDLGGPLIGRSQRLLIPGNDYDFLAVEIWLSNARVAGSSVDVAEAPVIGDRFGCLKSTTHGNSGLSRIRRHGSCAGDGLAGQEDDIAGYWPGGSLLLESCLSQTVHFPKIARCSRRERPYSEHPGRPYTLLQILQLLKLTVRPGIGCNLEADLTE